MLFMLPGAVSAISFLLLWRAGFLSRPGLAGFVCGTGIAVQTFSPPNSLVWTVALLLNVATAIYFLVRMKVG